MTTRSNQPGTTIQAGPECGETPTHGSHAVNSPHSSAIHNLNRSASARAELLAARIEHLLAFRSIKRRGDRAS